MSAAYWAQWDDLDEHDTNECHEEDDTEMCQESKCDCGNCMECFGMSWKDFY